MALDILCVTYFLASITMPYHRTSDMASDTVKVCFESIIERILKIDQFFATLST